MICLNFNHFLSAEGKCLGYVRKVLGVKEIENQEQGYRYGEITESYYYPAEEREAIWCNEGDVFVISDYFLEETFGVQLFSYFLVIVDTEMENNLRLLDCRYRVGGFDATEFPRPENIFVEKLFERGLF